LIAWGRVIAAEPVFASRDFTGWRPARGWFAAGRSGSAGGFPDGEAAGLVSLALSSAPADFLSPTTAFPSRKPAPTGPPRLLESLLAVGESPLAVGS